MIDEQTTPPDELTEDELDELVTDDDEDEDEDENAPDKE